MPYCMCASHVPTQFNPGLVLTNIGLNMLSCGAGALAQLNIETGVPIGELEPAIIALVLFNLVAALLPASGRFEEEEDDRRQPGALQVRHLDYRLPLSCANRLDWFDVVNSQARARFAIECCI